MSKQKRLNTALLQNKNSFVYYYYWIKLLCMTMFKWKNLPNGCDSDFIERKLFENGRVIFAKNKKYDIINLTLGEHYDINVYDKPIIYKGFAGDFEMECDFNNSYIIQNNILNLPTMPIACFFADKISKVDRVYDVNLLGQKTPLIFKASPEEIYTLEQIINDIYSNVPILKTKNNFNLNEKIEVLKTEVPYLLDKLRDDKLSVMSELLTFIGINNVNITKKERLVTAEAEGNNELTEMDLQIFLSKRQEGAEKVNELFGTNIEVECRKDVLKKFNETLKKLESGEENNTSTI